MTKAQFLDILFHPDNYVGCEIVMCIGHPTCRYGKIFYCTPDSFIYEYEDILREARYGSVNKENYLLCHFVHCKDNKKVL